MTSFSEHSSHFLFTAQHHSCTHAASSVNEIRLVDELTSYYSRHYVLVFHCCSRTDLLSWRQNVFTIEEITLNTSINELNEKSNLIFETSLNLISIKFIVHWQYFLCKCISKIDASQQDPEQCWCADAWQVHCLSCSSC